MMEWFFNVPVSLSFAPLTSGQQFFAFCLTLLLTFWAWQIVAKTTTTKSSRTCCPLGVKKTTIVFLFVLSLSTVLMICFDPLRRNFCVLTGRGLDRNCAAWIEKLPENAIDNTLNDAPPMPYLDTQQQSLLTRVCGATKTVKQRKGHCYSTYASFKMFLTPNPPPLHAK